MKRFPGRSLTSSRRWLVVPVSVTVALLAVGIALGAYFASQAIDGTSVAQEADQPTAAAPTADSSPAAAVTREPSPEPAADSSPPPAVTPELSPEPTALPTIPTSTRGALGCVDCSVKGGQQLAVTAEDIQLGPDGKYYVPDRGDGCAYREAGRGEVLGVEHVSLWASGCEHGIGYEPATGRVHVLIS